MKEKMMPAWKKVTLEQRLNDCNLMLLIHEVTTRAEFARIHLRIKKLQQKQAK